MPESLRLTIRFSVFKYKTEHQSVCLVSSELLKVLSKTNVAVELNRLALIKFA